MRAKVLRLVKEAISSRDSFSDLGGQAIKLPSAKTIDWLDRRFIGGSPRVKKTDIKKKDVSVRVVVKIIELVNGVALAVLSCCCKRIRHKQSPEESSRCAGQ